YQDLYLKNGVKNTGGMVTQLIEFETRNKMIIHILSLLVLQGRTTLVLSARREHLEWIYDALQKANLRKANGTFVTFGLYWGKQDMNKKQYKKMLEESAKCDIVLGTCQLAQEGLDIPTLDTLLFATPMTDIIQAVGRILRKYHAINPYVLDIVDKFGNFPKHLKQRQEFYDDEEYFCERTTTYLYELETDNKYEELITAFLDHQPDLTEFQANRGKGNQAIGVRRPRISPLPFCLEGSGNPSSGSLSDSLYGITMDDLDDNDDPTSICLPTGCHIDLDIGSSEETSMNTGVNETGGKETGKEIPDKRIPIKITPRLPSLSNRIKVSSIQANDQKKAALAVTAALAGVQNPILQKIKVSDIVVPEPSKVKVSSPINMTPKIKVGLPLNDSQKNGKIKVSEMVDNCVTKVKVVPQISEVSKVKISEVKEKIQDELENQKIKVNTLTNAILNNNKEKVQTIKTPEDRKVLSIKRKYF
ncbi:MAG: helicase-related protein, partial [Candidatus Paceibacterota bacterium]